jgi:hypothetical protein
MESPIDAAKVSMENARAAMEKIDHLNVARNSPLFLQKQIKQ